MEYKSNRSEKFAKWFQEQTGIDPTVPAFRKIIELEKQARLIVHKYDLIDSVEPKDMHFLARASKDLQKAYENESE